MHIYKVPALASKLFPGLLWNKPGTGKQVYLTFDDGPTPGVTDLILDELKKSETPATFFVTGEKAKKYQDLLKTLRNNGFEIGNHGMYHYRGFFVSSRRFSENVEEGYKESGSDVFRPPYGSINLFQYLRIRRKHKIVFWDIMPYDFDRDLTNKEIIEIVSKRIRPGSIIVLHDNNASRVPEILGELIEDLREKGYTFGNLTAFIK